jgi:predicted nucleic acid-binding protein
MIRGLLPVQPLTIEVHETGLALAERYGLSTFDALIVASARHADCDTLWSEDMQDGILLDDSLRIATRFVLRNVALLWGRSHARRRFRPHRREKSTCSAKG